MINVYSKSESELGRLLSNFAHTPFKLNGLLFQSVEAWWYWYITGEQHYELARFYGFRAKQEGRKYAQTQHVTPEVLKEVYRAKLQYHPEIAEMLAASTDEFDHYYVFGGKNVPATEWLWTAKLWETIRKESIS